VEECILLEVRKLLNYVSALKWLKHYLAERRPSADRLIKLREDLRRRAVTDNRNYEMLRQMVLTDIEEKLSQQEK
jgi:2-polyprenyl-6-methoxyphenol hydroxylase-like FAD-dependent oxidoreductase